MAATFPRCRALGRYPPEGKTVIDPQLMPLARAWRFSCCIKRSPAIDQVASWLSFIFRTLRIPRKHSSNDELIGDLQRSLNIIPGGHLTSFAHRPVWPPIMRGATRADAFWRYRRKWKQQANGAPPFGACDFGCGTELNLRHDLRSMSLLQVRVLPGRLLAHGCSCPCRYLVLYNVANEAA